MAVEQSIRPIELPRDASESLPCLALLFELGNDSDHKATKSKIKVTTPTPTSTFRELREIWLEKQKEVKEKRLQ
jgi:hypothetical protein